MIFKSINPDENPSDDEGSLTGDDPVVKILDICHDPMDDLEDHDPMDTFRMGTPVQRA